MSSAARPKVTIRLAREDERPKYALLCSNAYRNTVEHFSEWLSRTAVKDMLCLFEGDALAAALIIRPFEAFVGGQPIPLGGIAGVATFAECQGRGYAGMLMRESLRRMRKRGECLSALFPFSHPFYRHFGWIRCNQHYQFQDLSPRDFPSFPERQLVRRYVPGDDLRPLVRLHNRVMARYNLCASRTAERWQQIIDKLPERNAFLYTIQDGDEWIGHFICESRKREAFNFESSTRDLTMANPTAFRAMLGFLRYLPANVKSVSLQLPMGLDAWDLMDEPKAVRVVSQQQFRIVDLAEAIRRRGYRKGITGRLVVRIADADAPWNRGTWSMRWKDGRLVSVGRSTDRPTVQADIADFSQLYSGYKSATQLDALGRIQVDSPKAIDLMDALFHDRTTATQDWF